MVEQRGQTPNDEGRKSEDNFDVLPTHIPNGFLLVNHGTEPDLTRSATRKLRDVSMDHSARADVLRPLTKLYEKSRGELVKMFGENQGLRGFRDTELGREVQFNPKTGDVFDEELLDQSLGERFPEFVHTQDSISLVLQSPEEVAQVIKSMRRVLRRQGYSSDVIDVILKVEHEFRVDTEELSAAVDAEDVTLFDGAWKKKIVSVAIVPREIISNSELAAADEVAKASKDTPDAL